MQYMRLGVEEREQLLASLTAMPEYLEESLADLTPEQACVTAPDGSFSPVEQVWHLADLEREGFGARIEKLLQEQEPFLPDFDGEAKAAERNYRALSIAEALASFAQARRRNLDVLRSLDSQDWVRHGTQEGVGQVALCDIPSFMSQHDAAHRDEIEAWKRYFGV
jgi:hypothetical protein